MDPSGVGGSTIAIGIASQFQFSAANDFCLDAPFFFGSLTPSPPTKKEGPGWRDFLCFRNLEAAAARNKRNERVPAVAVARNGLMILAMPTAVSTMSCIATALQRQAVESQYSCAVQVTQVLDPSRHKGWAYTRKWRTRSNNILPVPLNTEQQRTRIGAICRLKSITS